jgi:hypothetical protein
LDYDGGEICFHRICIMRETTPDRDLHTPAPAGAPALSVVMLVPAGARRLQATLDSLLSQGGHRWELLAIVEHDTAEADVMALEEAALVDPRIRILQEAGDNPWAARNLGAMMARAPLLAFPAPGDVWSAGKLACHLALHDARPELVATYGRVAQIVPEGGMLMEARRLSRLHEGALALHDVLGDDPACMVCNLVVRRQAFLVRGGFDETLLHAQDQDLIARLIADGDPIAGIDAVLTERRCPAALPAAPTHMQVGWRQVITRHVPHAQIPHFEALQCRLIVEGLLRAGAPLSQALPHALSGLALDARAFLGGWRKAAALLAGGLWAALSPPGHRHRTAGKGTPYALHN